MVSPLRWLLLYLCSYKLGGFVTEVIYPAPVVGKDVLRVVHAILV
jgi:hypothetical protein